MIEPGGWDHAGVTVADIERSLEFYRGLLGMRLINRGEAVSTTWNRQPARVAWADLNAGRDHILELIQYIEPTGTRLNQEIADPGSGHIALRVEGIHDVYEQLLAAGVTTLCEPFERTEGPPWGHIMYFYARDPDGHAVELIERL